MKRTREVISLCLKEDGNPPGALELVDVH
jgi:hypothetical protein